MSETIPSWAVRGRLIVCIRESCKREASSYQAKCTMPKLGETYTIRHVMGTPAGVGVWLEEIVNPIGNPAKGWGGESGFHLVCFRPLVTLEDDIAAHFRQHLDVREPVGA